MSSRNCDLTIGLINPLNIGLLNIIALFVIHWNVNLNQGLAVCVWGKRGQRKEKVLDIYCGENETKARQHPSLSHTDRLPSAYYYEMLLKLFSNID